MLKEKLCNEVMISRNNKSTSIFLKRFILSIIEEALIDVYEENYSTRCLQSSLGIQKLLNEFGIVSKLFEGSCCFPNVKGENPYDFFWGGFWDNDHHIWLQSEFFEIIDFTITKLNQHPKSINNQNVHSIPVIWWSPADLTPSIFKYLPRKLNVQVTIDLRGKEKEDLENFLTRVQEIKNERLSENQKNYSLYQDEILENPESLDQLFRKGNHWLRGSFVVQQKNIAFPEWIIKKEQELMENYRNSL